MVSITNTGWCASTGRWSAGTDHWYPWMKNWYCFEDLHPGKSLTPASRHLSEELTGQWKTTIWRFISTLKMVIFHCHFGFRGCTLWKSNVLMLHGQTWPHRYAAGMIFFIFRTRRASHEWMQLTSNGAVLWVHHDRQFELIPSRELTYPLPTHVWRCFLFPRWDMLVSWRVPPPKYPNLDPS